MRTRRSVMVVLLALAAACSSETPTSVATTDVPPVPDTTVAPTTQPPDTTSPDTTSPDTTPVTTAPEPPATTEPAELVDVKAYFLLGERLVIDHRDVVPPGVMRGAIDALLDGPDDPGHATAVPDGTRLRGVNLVDGLATVDLTAEFESGGGSLHMLARVGQVVFTATQFDNVDAVEFWLDGEPIDYLGGEGIVMDEPWTRAMVTRELTGSVLVDTPRPGETVSSPFTVTGEADVFEGEFVIEIRRGPDVLVMVPMIRGGAWGNWDDFSATIDVEAPPGPIELVAIDAGGCGPPECEPVETVVELVLAN